MALTRIGMGKCHTEWKSAPLEELYEFKNGVNADRRAYGQGIPFINVLEPITYSHLRGHEISGRVTLSESAVSAYEVRNGDLVFNRTSEIGEEVGLAAAYLGNERVVFGGFVIRARPNSLAPDSRFAAYALRARAVRAQIVAMGQGAVRANVGQENLRRVELQFPQLPEQLAIAEALTDTDALIDSLEQLLAKKRQIQQGTMQQLLTGKRRLPGFALEWSAQLLRDIAEMKSGEAITSEQLSDVHPYPCFGGNGLRGYAESFTHDGHFALVGRQGALCGNVALARGKFFASEHAVVVTPRASVDIVWLHYVLVRMNLNQYSESSAQPGLSVERLMRLNILVPEPSEQAAIAQVLSDIDAEVTALESRLTKARAIKQAMAQALLTGRIRLPVGPEEPAAPVPPREAGNALESSPARAQESTT